VKRLTPARLAAAGLLLLAVVALVLWLAPSDSYIFLPDRARPVAPLVRVPGGKAPRDGGGIYFVDVLVRKASWLERLFPSIREGATIHPASDVQAPGVSEKAQHTEDLRAMSRSQDVAAAVALRALGYKVTTRSTGVLVENVARGAPAAGRLFPTDVIVSVDGRRVRTPEDLRAILRSRRVGTTFRIGVRRGGALTQVQIRTISDPSQRGRPILGILVGEAASVRLPINVRIDAGDIGGPSAGLAFALDILEQLGRDVDHGRRIAATGEIELDGTVGPIGGVKQKTFAVRKAGIHVFLVPTAGENAAEARRYAHGLRIIPVQNFQQALRALATLPSD
jgi:PDZ domain-containing protein